MAVDRTVVLRPYKKALSIRDVCGILKTDKKISVEEMDTASESCTPPTEKVKDNPLN